MGTETTWYYADRHGHQQGPLSRDAMLQVIERERLPPETLVWRDGLAQWQPLSSLTAELGQPVAPPPVPPAVPPPFAAASAPIPAGAIAPATVVYAGFVRRWAALLVDSLVLGAISFMLFFVLALLFGMSALADDSSDAFGTTRVLMLYPLAFAIGLLYFALQESSVHQATLGKRALGIKVTDLTGRRISFAHAVGRWFAAALSYLTLYIGFLMAAFTARKQALHDMVAGTLVVDRWAYTDQPQRQSQTSGCLVALMIVVLGIVPVIAILAAIAIPQYQVYVQRSQVTLAMAQATPAQARVAEAWATTGECPQNGSDGIGSAASYASPQLQSIDVGTMKDDGSCALELTLHTPSHSRLDGKRIWLTMQTAKGQAPVWHCQSELDNRYLPMECRTPAP